MAKRVKRKIKKDRASPDEEGMTKYEVNVAKAAFRLAMEVVGGQQRFGELINASDGYTRQWTVLPIKWVKEAERLSGVSRVYLRPDLYKLEVKLEPDEDE